MKKILGEIKELNITVYLDTEKGAHGAIIVDDPDGNFSDEEKAQMIKETMEEMAIEKPLTNATEKELPNCFNISLSPHAH